MCAENEAVLSKCEVPCERDSEDVAEHSKTGVAYVPWQAWLRFARPQLFVQDDACCRRPLTARRPSVRKAFKAGEVTMFYKGVSVGLVNIFSGIRGRWKQYCLEAACDTALNVWQEEHPEYVDKVRRWIETDTIPEDNDLETLCRVYEERMRSRTCYRHPKT